MVQSGSIQKTFKLTTSYYESAPCSGCTTLLPYSAMIDARRLRLDAIQEFDGTGNSIPSTRFFYNSTLLPRRYSLARDNWGYYNGRDSNTGLFQDGTMSPFGVQQYTGNFRNVDETKMIAGILTRIQYPTGGSTSFFYEANRISNSADLVGGLRVTRIENDDGNRIVRTRVFEYSEAKLFDLIPDPTRFQIPRGSHTANWYVAEDFGTIVHADMLPGLRSNHGYHIGYSRVSETDGAGTTKYLFVGNAPVQPSPLDFPPRPAFSRLGTGELFSEEVQDNVGSIKKMVVYNKAEGGNQPTNVRAIKVVNSPCYTRDLVNPAATKQECLDSPYPFLTEYSIETNRYHLMSKEEIQDGVQTKTFFEYGFAHNSPTAQYFFRSDGLQQRSEFTYPNVSTSAPFEMYQSFLPNFKNMLTTVIERKDLVNGNLVSRQLNTFSSDAGKVLLTRIENFPTGGGSPQIETYNYDKVGNITEINKSNGDTESFLWGYKNSFPVAAVKNAKLMAVPSAQATNFGASITNNVANFVDIGNYSRSESDNVSINIITTGGGSGQRVKVQIKNAAGTLVFGPTEYPVPGTHSAPTISLAPGSYTVSYVASGFSATGFVGLTVQLTGTTYRQRVFYTSFEEDGVLLSDAIAGKRVNAGQFKVPTPAQNGNYKITYWQKATEGSPWSMIEQQVSVSNGVPAEVTVGQGVLYIDEVRLFPEGAQMTTYNFEPGVGLITLMDPNGKVTYYEYDSFNRLRLVRDQYRNIVKEHLYNFRK